MKVVICWTGVSGYLAACWRELVKRPGLDVRFILFPTLGTANSPFADDLLAGLPVERVEEKYLDDPRHTAGLAANHRPDVIVIAGWAYRAFTAMPFDARLVGVKFAMTMDTPRKDNLRQKLARLKIGRLLKRVHCAIVPGERSWQFARQLGFPETRIHRAMYGFNADAFAGALERRMARPAGWPRQFLFVGRYVPAKGLDVLLAAYAEYRRQVKDPWGLTCCGQGPMSAAIAAAEGVTDRGFVQPPDQSAVFEEHGAFVIASLYEPWGVAIAEGMSAGLPAICTEACGASVELVRPYWNGIGVGSGDVPSLARAMRWIHEHQAQLPEMGRRARESAAAFSAQAWAQRWEEMLRELA